MKSRLSLNLCVLAAAAAGLSACGGDEGGGTAADATYADMALPETDATPVADMAVEVPDMPAAPTSDAAVAVPDADIDAAPDAEPDAAVPPGTPLVVMSFNVGNPDEMEPHYPLRLSYQSYEDFVRDQIAALQPDIIALQESLPEQTCAAFDEADPLRTCYDAANRPRAAARMLGPSYTIVCDQRKHVECIGVHQAFGTIDGFEPGSVSDGAETPPLPMDGCVYFQGTCGEDNCDDESTVSAVSVTTDKGPLRVVHMHPNASGTNAAGFYFGRTCRDAQIQQGFDDLAGDHGPALLLGDWNMDPGMALYASEKPFWESYVGEGKRFHDHDQRDGAGRRIATNNRVAVAIDHVVSDFATGTCEVRANPLIDADYDFSQLPDGENFTGRLDHRAVVCPLSWP